VDEMVIMVEMVKIVCRVDKMSKKMSSKNAQAFLFLVGYERSTAISFIIEHLKFPSSDEQTLPPFHADHRRPGCHPESGPVPDEYHRDLR
jgi:hypothetical protein